MPEVGSHRSNDLEEAHSAEMRPAAGKQPGRRGIHTFKPFRDRTLRPRGNRHEPLLSTLASNHQEWLAGPDSAAREADQLARSQSRAIEELKQGEITPRKRFAAGSAFLGGLEHPPDFLLVQDPRQWTLEARPRQGGRRVVAAKPLVDEKAEEPPERSRPPRDRRRRKVGPAASEARDILERSRPNRSQHLCRSVEVIAIGSERKFRRARFGRHHVEEPVDKRSVVGDHVRERASAAIIRAVKSWLVR